jgi:hypothetical protein
MIARLFLLAHGRSGDKGDAANIGIIARREDWFPFIAQQLTRDRVEKFLKPLAEGPVERFELPNLWALNFLVHQALGGGGSLSLRLDAQGKTYAQALLRMPLRLPAGLEKEVETFWGERLPSDCVLTESQAAALGGVR